jgi:hypothetical protein
MKNTDTKTHDERLAEIAAIEQSAAAARAEHERILAAENLRRRPINVLLDARKKLQAQIAWAKSIISSHQKDSDEFEKMCDSFFNTPCGDQPRMYNFLVASQNYPFAAASRAVELLTARLVKAEKDLSNLEKETLALAAKLDLKELLPAELL